MPDDTTDFGQKVLLVLLDKGVLAIVVALLGLFGASLVERYKAALTTQAELAKRRIEAAAAVCAKLELMRRILGSLHNTVRRGMDWEKKKDEHETSSSAQEGIDRLKEELRVLSVAIGKSLEDDETNLRNAVMEVDVDLSATFAQNRYWLGSSLYRRCTHSHEAMLEWFKALGEKDKKAISAAWSKSEESVIDLNDVLGRRTSAVISPIGLVLVIVVVLATFYFLLR
ncbi:hypothetical protein [Bradyrhizobium sp. CB2312]|uniref:hypothetical protein n=1 Tax=Bradyrhizobium sp. CB2312 TaxID=3039155 RepID=UPI0024B28104|nr:hypothetical protein [Bradyrhizobium sp. CB2312]WFU70095.1 hypothetical protein QA642_33145 [Bradyrhizobium sp. CB2312]